MEIFRWDQNYETGLEAVDGQHRGLVTLINRFGSLIEAGEALDPATFEQVFSELAAAHRHGEPLSLILMDADGFKAVNGTYGHDAGDEVIRALGAALKQLFRAHDVVCRMGGDEFLAAERARSSIASMEIPAGAGAWKGSLSAGVATLGPGLQDAEALLKAADVAVYEAKRQGRNRVVVFRNQGVFSISPA